jgi:hypothetical protein
MGLSATPAPCPKPSPRGLNWSMAFAIGSIIPLRGGSHDDDDDTNEIPPTLDFDVG